MDRYHKAQSKLSNAASKLPHVALHLHRLLFPPLALGDLVVDDVLALRLVGGVRDPEHKVYLLDLGFELSYFFRIGEIAGCGF